MGDTKTTAYDTWIQNALGFDIAERRKQVREQVPSGGRARSNSFTPGERRPEPGKEEAAYLQRLREVTGRVRSAQGDGAKMPDGVATNLKQAGDLASQRNYDEAIVSLNQVDALVTQAEAAAKRDKLKKEFASISMAANQAVTPMPGDPPWFAGAVDPASRLLNSLKRALFANEAKSIEEITRELEQLKDLVPRIEPVHKVRLEYVFYARSTRPQILQSLSIAPGDNKPLAEAQAALRKTDTAIMADSFKDLSPGDAKNLIGAADVQLKDVQRLASQHVAQLANAKGAKKSDVRAKVVELVAIDPDILKRLAEAPEGRKVLDDLMQGVGKNKKGDTDSKFVVAALEARFGAKFTGDLDNLGGVRLYEVFKMVPDEHTIGNPKIAEVKRNRNYEGMSWYSAGDDKSEGVGKHHMVINGARTGGVQGWVVDTIVNTSNPITKGQTKYQNVKGEKKFNAFNHVTLHEIGHGVDEKEGFMTKNGSATGFGGWLEHSIEEVASLIGTETGFFTEFKAQPGALLRTYLVCALSKGFSASKLKERGKATAKVSKEDLLGDAGVQAAEAARIKLDKDGWEKDAIKREKQAALKAIALKGDAKKLAEAAVEEILGNRTMAQVVGELMSLKPNPGIDWDALSKHKAIKTCTTIKLAGSDKGLWVQGAAAANSAVGGRVYQEAYPGDWFSYAPSALSQRVTNYQFRSPAEWFADAYACYFLGKLPDGHPLGRWLDTQVAPK